jgi:sulfur-oxidizing protein SoxY
MTSRRELLSHGTTLLGLLATAGLLPTAARAAWNAGAFDAKTLSAVVRALGGQAPVESRDVNLTAPDIADDGAVVPLGVATSLAGVRRLLLLVEKNPSVLSAIVEVGDGLEPMISTRVKMSQSSDVYGVAMMTDGRVLFARKDVKVTLGGCGV